MKLFIKLLVCISFLAAIASATACEKSNDYSAETELKDDIDKQSYALGMNIGTSFKDQKIEVNKDVFFHAFLQGFDGKDSKMSDEEIMKALTDLKGNIAAKQQAEKIKQTEANKAEGQSFHEKKKSEDGVITLPSGLQYKVLSSATGKKPSGADAEVKVHYEGKLLNGDIFDSSYERNSPAQFKLNQVIAGWTEGLQQMNVGATWEFYIPSELAYGPTPPPGSNIGPNATLIFKVELLETN